MATDVKKKSPRRTFNTVHATRGVWLVKVPNYLSEAWRKAGKGESLGKMKITRANKAQVQFFLDPDLIQMKSGDAKSLELPREHKVNIHQTSSQCLHTFSEDMSSGELASEGKVIQRAEIQPVNSPKYMILKRHQMQHAEKTKFTVQHLSETPTNSYKPVSIHKEDKEHELKKKKELKKARDEKGVVLDLLFSAFQHSDQYSLKDLVNITQQPVVYLKEILKEVCVNHTKGAFKYMWELKPEYKMSNTSGTSTVPTSQ